MALTNAERAALVTLLKEEVKAEMRAAYSDSQNTGSESAGPSGDAGEKYNPSAMKNEFVMDAVMKRLDALHAKMDAMEESDKKLKSEGMRGLDDGENIDEREGENEIPTRGQPKRLAADKECRMDL